MIRALLAAALACFALVAAAATPQFTSVLNWSAVTLDTTGKPDLGPVTYNVYATYTAGGTFTQIATVTGLSYTDVSSSLAVGVTACYQISAVAGGVVGPPSTTICKVFTQPLPMATTQLRVT